MKGFRCFFSIAIIFLSLISGLIAQNQKSLNSLKQLQLNVHHDTSRIRILLEIGAGYEIIKPDSSLIYYKKAVNLAENSKDIDVGNSILLGTLHIQRAKGLRSIGGVFADRGDYGAAIDYFSKALQIAEEISSHTDKPLAFSGKLLVCQCYTSIGKIHLDQGSYDVASQYFNRAILLYTEMSRLPEKSNSQVGIKGISKCYINLGIVALDQGKYATANGLFFKALTIKERLNDRVGVSACYTNIGLVHSFQKNYTKAIEYYKRSLAIDESLGDKKGMSTCYTNMGNAISDLGILSKREGEMSLMYRQSIEYYKKSLVIKRELGDRKGMSTCFTNMGSVLTDQAKATKSGNLRVAILGEAIGYYQKSVQIDSLLGDKKGLALLYGNLSSLHLSLADPQVTQSKAIRERHNFAAIAFAKKAYKVATEIKAFPEIFSSARHLYKGYTAIGDYKKALRFANICLSTKDSLFSDEKTNSMAEMEARYQMERKQLEIQTLNKEQELQKSKNAKQKIVIISSLAGIILLIAFALFVVNRLLVAHRQKRIIESQKNLVDEKNLMLHLQNEEIVSQRDEIEAQRDLVIAQKGQLESIFKNVNQSIDYATLIQSSILPEDGLLCELFASFFMLYKPKDKVSGDFYWWADVNGHTIIVVADCTGHGVPGAFMSILGSSLLREIVQKECITNPAEILEKLREEIIRSLKQKTCNDGQRDGMDMAIVSINRENNLLTFAGASMPLWIVRTSSGNLVDSFDLIELKEDKMPVGIHERMDPFSNQDMYLHSGDILYLFSDGFVDQFGGTDKRKYSSKNLRKLLLDNADKSMVDQKIIIDKTNESWRNSKESGSDQTDDITMLGLKVR